MTPFWKPFGIRDRKGRSPPGGIDGAAVMGGLYEYIDGELDEDTLGKVRRHLELCKKCHDHYRFERAFLRFLRDRSSISVPPQLHRKISHMIREEEKEEAG